MKFHFISHRGNINGREEKKENTIKHIWKALSEGFDVEVDVWFECDEYWLGHAKPIQPIRKELLQNSSIWCHAKNTETLYKMLEDNIHCFMHNEDKGTLTSRGFIWTYPGEKITPASITIPPNESLEGAGVCSDNVRRLRERCIL